jgi:lipid-binding SYLF domain-containing protein
MVRAAELDMTGMARVLIAPDRPPGETNPVSPDGFPAAKRGVPRTRFGADDRRKEAHMRTLFTCLLTGLLVAPAIAGETREAKQLNEAAQVLARSASAPDKGIPKDLLEKAECIGVFPGVKKGAFVLGGEFGRGVFTCRMKDGSMSAPAFFTIGGPSIGWQFGGKEADLILLIMNEDGVKHLLQDRFTLGGEAAAVAGPVGRTAEAATDLQLHAQILSWSRSRGIFLGASLEGTVVSPSKDAIAALYGKPHSAREILVEQNVKVPKAARPYISTVDEYARRS